MTQSRKVTKCGNSLAICIPKELLCFIGADHGTTVFIEAKPSAIHGRMLQIYLPVKERICKHSSQQSVSKTED